MDQLNKVKEWFVGLDNKKKFAVLAVVIVELGIHVAAFSTMF